MYIGYSIFGLLAATWAIYWPLPSSFEVPKLARLLRLAKNGLGVGFFRTGLLAVGNLDPERYAVEDVLLRGTYILLCFILFYVEWLAQITGMENAQNRAASVDIGSVANAVFSDARRKVIFPALIAGISDFVLWIVFRYDGFPTHATVFGACFSVFVSLVRVLYRDRSD